MSAILLLQLSDLVASLVLISCQVQVGQSNLSPFILEIQTSFFINRYLIDEDMIQNINVINFTCNLSQFDVVFMKVNLKLLCLLIPH